MPFDDILNAESTPQNWLTYSGTYAAHRFSYLDAINKSNVHRLRVSRVIQLSHLEPRFETTPLVMNGVMFFTEPPSKVIAIDLASGRSLWSYESDVPEGLSLCCVAGTRGVAVLDSTVIVGTIDARLIALGSSRGNVLWDVEVADPANGYSITSAPLVLRDQVIIGVGGGEFGIRGFLDSYDIDTGRRRWRFWTVPAPGEPGSDTWSGQSWQHGGAPTWLTGSFDPDLNLVYWTTGNPGPNFIGGRRRGDNLYSNSAVALDADSGILKWHFQFTPHDTHD